MKKVVLYDEYLKKIKGGTYMTRLKSRDALIELHKSISDSKLRYERLVSEEWMTLVLYDRHGEELARIATNIR